MSSHAIGPKPSCGWVHNTQVSETDDGLDDGLDDSLNDGLIDGLDDGLGDDEEGDENELSGADALDVNDDDDACVD